MGKTLAIFCALAAAGLISCKREARNFRPAPARMAVFGDAAPESDLRPGGPPTSTQPAPRVSNPYNGNAQAINDGQRLFNWYNCAGCHANGGGGIGPAFLDNVWIYGGEPANIFDSIIKGRPNGMPTWGGKIPEDQVWKIVAYVRSLSGEQPRSATPARTDTIQQSPLAIQNRTTGRTK